MLPAIRYPHSPTTLARNQRPSPGQAAQTCEVTLEPLRENSNGWYTAFAINHLKQT